MTEESRIYGSKAIQLLCDILLSILSFKRRLFGSKAQRAVIVSIHKLGDTVFTIPAIRQIIDLGKYSEITIITNSAGKEIYSLNFPDVSYLVVDRNAFLLSGRIVNFSYWWKLLKLRSGIVFDLSGGIHSASICSLIISKELAGINERLYRKLYSTFIPIRKTPHIMDIYLDIVRNYFDTVIGENVKEFACTTNKIENIILAPSGGWKAKEWGLYNFLNLYELLKENYKVTVLTEKGTLENDVIENMDVLRVNYIETTSISELLQRVQETDLFISNDTGPLYIANMLGKPTFAIYGPTNPVFHLPYGDAHGFILKNVPCSPVTEKYCYTLGGRNCLHYTCMTGLVVDEVYDAIIAFINNFNQNRQPDA